MGIVEWSRQRWALSDDDVLSQPEAGLWAGMDISSLLTYGIFKSARARKKETIPQQREESLEVKTWKTSHLSHP